jgi:hypothetical protein
MHLPINFFQDILTIFPKEDPEGYVGREVLIGPSSLKECALSDGYLMSIASK